MHLEASCVAPPADAPPPASVAYCMIVDGDRTSGGANLTAQLQGQVGGLSDNAAIAVLWCDAGEAARAALKDLCEVMAEELRSGRLLLYVCLAPAVAMKRVLSYNTILTVAAGHGYDWLVLCDIGDRMPTTEHALQTAHGAIQDAVKQGMKSAITLGKSYAGVAVGSLAATWIQSGFLEESLRGYHLWRQVELLAAEADALVRYVDGFTIADFLLVASQSSRDMDPVLPWEEDFYKSRLAAAPTGKSNNDLLRSVGVPASRLKYAEDAIFSEGASVCDAGLSL